MIKNIDALSYKASTRYPGYYTFTYKGESFTNWNLADWININFYEFHHLMKHQFNAELLFAGGELRVYFKDEKVIIELLDWMKSIILARFLIGDTKDHICKMKKN